MYKLSKVDREVLLATVVTGEQHGAGLDAVEQKVQGTLPHIPGLAEAGSSDERSAILGRTAAVQRERFMHRYGSPFGTDDVKGNRATQEQSHQHWPVSVANYGS